MLMQRKPLGTEGREECEEEDGEKQTESLGAEDERR
jgi:hypothetical protein